MPFYHKQGKIPPKRHTAFKKEDGSLYYEELVSREGFSGIYSNLYHLQRPTKISKVGELFKQELSKAKTKHRARHITTASLKTTGDVLSARIPLFFNSDVIISVAVVSENMDYCYRNGTVDEVLYIQSGEGKFISNFGNLHVKSGDYVVIPRGVIWQINPTDTVRMLVIESAGPVETPNRYRNRFGQLLEHSPFCERDIQVPELQDPITNKKE